MIFVLEKLDPKVAKHCYLKSNVNFKFCGYAELTFNESYTISIVVRPLNVAFVLT